MDAPATIVWIAPGAPDAAEARALASWARAHGVVLAPPRDEGGPPVLAVDPGLVGTVETSLDRARDAIAARDGDAVDGALSAAESALRAHPELPQSAWLMAEVERTRATRWRRVPPADLEAADRAWLRAEALDAGRVPGVGEDAARAHPAPATLVIDLVPAPAPRARVWLDGVETPATATTRAGPHALAVTWEAAPVWAAWIDAPAGSTVVHVAMPAPSPCSRADVAGATVTVAPAPGQVDAAGVRCERWVAAASGAQRGAVRVATCERDRCGPFVEWAELSWAERPAPPLVARGAHASKWPAWATWALVGGAAALATSAVIIASGALQPLPTETHFKNGGIKTQ